MPCVGAGLFLSFDAGGSPSPLEATSECTLRPAAAKGVASPTKVAFAQFSGCHAVIPGSSVLQRLLKHNDVVGSLLAYSLD
jgi:hypothetical protein